jgi:hypothetical protein
MASPFVQICFLGIQYRLLPASYDGSGDGKFLYFAFDDNRRRPVSVRAKLPGK